MGGRTYDHPHPDPCHVMRTYRRYLLAAKRKFGSNKGLIHRRGLIETYLAAKEECRRRDHDSF